MTDPTCDRCEATITPDNRVLTADGEYCSMGCAYGPCPTCGRTVGSRFWTACFVTDRGLGVRRTFCSKGCADAKSAELVERQRHLDRVYESFRALTALFFRVALLDSIARVLFNIDAEVLETLERIGDYRLGGEFRGERFVAALDRAWEMDLGGRRTAARRQAERVVLEGGALARGAQ